MENRIDESRLVILINEDKDKFVQKLKNFVNSEDNKLVGVLVQPLDDIISLFDN